jgi:hypothetical protein
MKKRNEGWTRYLKTDIGRQMLWLSLAISVASLLVAGIAFSLQGRPGRPIEGSLIKQLEEQDQAPSSNFIKHDPTKTDPFPNHFLIYNGVDNAQSACTYYKALKAITEDCNNLTTDGIFNFFKLANGNIVGITFDAWKTRNGLNTGVVSALYFNAIDLALARSMHGKTSNGTTAYYVCNYRTLEEAKEDPQNNNALACVAFDTEIDSSTNRPFTKFYVFKKDPLSGIFRLAASAALDEGGEKFVPGLCKACHGGSSGSFPARGDNATTGDIGANFLPFDLDNFDYLEDSTFSRRAQESNFKRLNQMILQTDPVCMTNPGNALCRAPVIRELVEGWYLDGRNVQDSQFIPPGWMGHGQLYRNVVKPFCRTCHVAMSPELNFNRFENLAMDDPRTPANDRQGSFKDRFTINDKINAGSIATFVCSNRFMPQSAVTFDQFWLNRAARAVLTRFLRDARGEPSFQCPPP